MNPKPRKAESARTPMRTPPSQQSLAARGLELRKTKRQRWDEDGSKALERARSFEWGHRIVRDEPFQARGLWLWVCSKEAA